MPREAVSPVLRMPQIEVQWSAVLLGGHVFRIGQRIQRSLQNIAKHCNKPSCIT